MIFELACDMHASVCIFLLNCTNSPNYLVVFLVGQATHGIKVCNPQSVVQNFVSINYLRCEISSVLKIYLD